MAAAGLSNGAPCPLAPLQVDQLAAEVSQLRNVNSASVVQSEERLRALQAQYEDLMGWVLLPLCVLCCGGAGACAWHVWRPTLSAAGRMQVPFAGANALPPPLLPAGWLTCCLVCCSGKISPGCRQCELDNATLHRDLSAALEKVLNHKLQLQVGGWAGCWMRGWLGGRVGGCWHGPSAAWLMIACCAS